MCKECVTEAREVIMNYDGVSFDSVELLAEFVAHECHHYEWLNDGTHWVWAMCDNALNGKRY